jgi:hypothetical protein
MLAFFKQIYRFLHPKHQNVFLDYKVTFKPRYGHGLEPHKALYHIINANRGTYADFLSSALLIKDKIHEILPSKININPYLPTWNNGFLPGLDIIGIYTMLSTVRPARYIEVGSGNSTKVARKAISDFNLATKITSIDPHPRAEIDSLADIIIRLPFENISLDEMLNLEENDILFIDNSHRILPNSDAMVFFMEILPELKKGVIVHLHDIFLPYDYPQVMCDRAYSEQYGLAFYLLANPSKYTTILPNYFISEDQELAAIIQPIWNHPNLDGVEQHGGSFWIRINE